MYIGREREEREFGQLLKKPTASLVTCQGRRRIGKSTFIGHCAKHADHFLSFAGLPPRKDLTRQDQLGAFAESLAAQTQAPRLALESWPQALQLMASLLPRKGATVVLLDEISWMGIGDPDFAGHLKTAWDHHFSRQARLILVLCGSVSSWIEENILNSTGFVGRCSWQFRLEPLELPYCHEFWRGRKNRVSAADKLRVLAVTGGVPRYLEEIDPSETAEQNIERLCFNKGGLLFNEFEQIFHDIFTRKASGYRDVVRALVTGRRSVSQISKVLKRERGGTLSGALSDLEAAGFIRKDQAFDPQSGETRQRSILYRLSDNYLRFYLRYIAQAREQIRKGLYQRAPLESLEAWDTIMGLQFENLVLGSIEPLMREIGLGNIPVLNAGPYFQRASQKQKGCQIDLLVRTRRSLYVFEIKFRKLIAKSVISDVKERISRLRLPRAVSVRTGLIYQGDLDPEVAATDYFDFKVPFEKLLG